MALHKPNLKNEIN